MARFTNQAQLLFNNVAIPSNIAVGEITDVLAATKTPLLGIYRRGDRVTFYITLVNSSNRDITGVQASDNMGGYQTEGRTVYPMDYVPGSAKLLINGVTRAGPTVAAGTPTVFSGITVPANGNATIIYEAQLNDFAPLAPSENVENIVTITGAGIVNPIVANAVISPDNAAQLSVNKAVDPVPVQEGGTLTYTFTISNMGATPIIAGDNVTISDTFQPVLNNLNVSFNGAPWVENTDYTYNPATGQFVSLAGNITVPAATYEVDQATGVWTANPGTSTLVISGRV